MPRAWELHGRQGRPVRSFSSLRIRRTIPLWRARWPDTTYTRPQQKVVWPKSWNRQQDNPPTKTNTKPSAAAERTHAQSQRVPGRPSHTRQTVPDAVVGVFHRRTYPVPTYTHPARQTDFLHKTTTHSTYSSPLHCSILPRLPPSTNTTQVDTLSLPCTYPTPLQGRPGSAYPAPTLHRCRVSHIQPTLHHYPVPTLHRRQNRRASSPAPRPPGTPRPAPSLPRNTADPAPVNNYSGSTYPAPHAAPPPLQAPRGARRPVPATRRSMATFRLVLYGKRRKTTHEQPKYPAQVKPTYPVPTLHPAAHATLDGHAILTKSDRLTLYLLPHARIRQADPPSLSHSREPPTHSRLAGPVLGKSRRRTAYPQQIVTTRLLYCLQDRFAQLSRLQRI